MIDYIIPKYNINRSESFMFLEKKELEEFMDFSSEVHSHNFYILSFLYQGSINHLSDFESKQISAPAILMLDVDQVHIHPEKINSEMVSLVFSPDFIVDQTKLFLEKVSILYSRSHFEISVEQLQELDDIIRLIKKESQKEIRDDELIKSLLPVLVLQCFKFSEIYQIPDHGNQEIFHHFKLLVKQNYRTQHQVKFYSEQLNMTTHTLNQSLRRSTFKTPKQLIDEQLILEAKRLLFYTTTSAKEVAWELGFETDSYFNYFFKKHTGQTPKEFKRNRSCM